MAKNVSLSELCDVDSSNSNAEAKKKKIECETVKFLGVSSKRGRWGKWSRNSKSGANSTNSVWNWRGSDRVTVVCSRCEKEGSMFYCE